MTENSEDSFNKINNGGRLEIIYYTDPLCCWSWAFEPQWRRLRYEFGSNINWRYRMGGLISGWKEFNDPFNSISRPAQMGPLWMEASHISGMPIDNTIWIKDYPYSSYPACIAFKCAEIQSPEAAEQYLRLLREAVMLNGLNIAKEEVLLRLANELESKSPFDFNAKIFVRDLQSGAGQKMFLEDLKDLRYHQIGRFPSLIIKNTDTNKAVIIVGYRPYNVLLEAVFAVAPNLAPIEMNEEEYKGFWGNVIEREMKEVTKSRSGLKAKMGK
ncbi:MAG TPA: DsbA family protein [Cytophagales bacterium]|nr:DsbA family protein [Cytophagales bacterium]